MVGPSATEEERRVASFRLQIGFVLLVGASGGLVAVRMSPTLIQLGAAVVAGLGLGVGLLAFLRWSLPGAGFPGWR